ncbi:MULTISPECIES: aminotransferase class III-fold pyridoxal phosphate-dependent enzyme [unclassified Desulfovibrio]|uniref:taurine--pyruvate aminotransferase n=1 Tax=unclassified Desulfovibrio TaxID=2593640 RepID=UPI0013ECDE25|nr:MULTISPECIES: aminotransferase class III-fold pyridoxal phosphate-dependent enzyme [unclassified Desulfovibrio]
MAQSFNAAELIADDKKYVWHHLTQHKVYEKSDPIIFVKGEGMRVTDINGKQYLDAVSGGVWTVNLGYGNETLVKAVSDQIKELCYFANGYGNIPTIRFSKKLIEKMPGLSRVYLSNSGSEANEKAFKIVRQISQLKHGGKKYKIIYRNRDYHGTTITTLSACGQEERKMQYGPFTPGFVEFPACSVYRSPYPAGTTNLGEKFALELEKVVQAEDPDTVGAVILEPITAGGGVIVPPDGYFETISEICKKYGLLLIIDEVVCGLGRTGKWFGYQHFNVKPDIVTMAKGVAAGYAPISCTVTTEEVFQDFIADPSDREGYFRDISTFGGCTSGPAAGYANLCYMEEHNVLDNVVKMGEYLLNGLKELEKKYEIIGDVRGKGLFCGLELVKDRATREPVSEAVAGAVVAECMKQGVIIGKTSRSFREFNNTICLAPALITTTVELDEILKALDNAFKVVKA